MISVIVPVYKAEPYLRKCVDSILGQTFADFELILVDDGSPDGCPVICDEYAERDRRIHVIHQENGGLSAARNAGIDWAFANSDSQWLSFIDSDDWVHPEYLKRLLDAALEHQVSISICGYAETEGEEPLIKKEDFAVAVWTPEAFFSEHNINATVAWGKLYRKKSFEKIRYPVGKIHEDEFITYQILFRWSTVVVVPAPLYYYFQNKNGIMKSPWTPKRLDSVEAKEEQKKFFQKHGYWDAYRVVEKWFVLELTHCIQELEQFTMDNREKSRLLYALRQKLRSALVESKEIYPFGKNKWIYEMAFPGVMHFYWIVKVIKKKLCVLFRKGEGDD
ncbi:glycosyltransferase family 2 protein [Dysosmobacter sp. Sow4_B12]|uniref:glycosyltransferase family 2 protein n=1 Tax=Dysosmobacter sp. Sow4_B12 TaxID=3438777 RepID=UPI003F8E7DD0